MPSIRRHTSIRPILEFAADKQLHIIFDQIYAFSLLTTIGAELNFLFGPSSVVQQTLASLLADHQWIHSYINMSRTCLVEQYQLVKERSEKLDQRIIIRTPEASFSIWISFRILMH
ncbi:unnamed protein product [Rotaria socialis]|uniref:Uncharacterized protein n=1 Tax=Rotaria socialis TaxID=392032 RepID=A0A817W1A6_9BILA|nr:unnamed protein product [Rotaria socialis]CAF3349819.1 unnamed protein product [Rotaria socialis]CAF4324456.1 unnamed protein product [Rotaria socialis]CAF4673460.1 unnamed protein product [Rotaria socialis]